MIFVNRPIFTVLFLSSKAGSRLLDSIPVRTNDPFVVTCGELIGNRSGSSNIFNNGVPSVEWSLPNGGVGAINLVNSSSVNGSIFCLSSGEMLVNLKQRFT